MEIFNNEFEAQEVIFSQVSDPDNFKKGVIYKEPKLKQYFLFQNELAGSVFVGGNSKQPKDFGFKYSWLLGTNINKNKLYSIKGFPFYKINNLFISAPKEKNILRKLKYTIIEGLEFNIQTKNNSWYPCTIIKKNNELWILQNNHPGKMPSNINPKDFGFKYSWLMSFFNEDLENFIEGLAQLIHTKSTAVLTPKNSSYSFRRAKTDNPPHEVEDSKSVFKRNSLFPKATWN